jgi:serine/threonine protein kinase
MSDHLSPEKTDSDRERIDLVCDRFEAAWQSGQPPRIEDYLVMGTPAEGSPFARQLLIELVAIDLQYRWLPPACGSVDAATPVYHRTSDEDTHPATAPLARLHHLEDYVGRYPLLGPLSEIPFHLIAREYRLRRQSGEQPDHGEYLARFGRHRAGLTELLSRIDQEFAEDAGEDSVQAEPTATHPDRIDRYQVESVLGQGGFGTVYKAYDPELQRQVAIKVPRQHLVASSEDWETFVAEARILARLDHPGIVPVFDFGRNEQSLCYVVSKLIEGTDLKRLLRENRPSFVESVVLTASVAEALHHAHKSRLVHRDVKPANLLIDSEGRPYVADFGLALNEIEFAKGKRFAGTPAYMSPEQARGEGHLVDGRSDIFSLGAVFYELLTGERPFRGTSTHGLLDQIKRVEPCPPRQINDQIPRELERICLKALSKRVSDRYTTALDLTTDLRRWVLEAEERTSAEERATTSAVAVVTPPTPAAGPPRIVPKGLRSFDRNDADFFLQLLPGPFDRDGLPTTIRFWKTSIEETDPDNTFRVGVIYGPSGCGKSSLLKAGLLPRLSEHVIHFYVEARPDGTETQLLNRLERAFPDLPPQGGLIDWLSQLRRGRGIAWDTKVLVVLDQFEQWLHDRHDYGETELAHALRHCDGRHVQCILMVRDDFWMALSRFMRELDVAVSEGDNSAPVDLFDMPHARRVLQAFGKAYGRLPETAEELSREQSRFLDDAVEAVAEDRRVIAVRISLLAEMLKGRAWAPSTLRELGGEEGIRQKYLEDTFSGPHAPPQHKLHEKAIRRVLSCLLPDEQHVLKGAMRSREELLGASEYSGRERDFDEVLQILDGLHLITPADPEGAAHGESESSDQATTEEKHYQLTHDYLVPSLREWLHRKRRESRRGRAELLLEARAQEWSRSPQNRFLPSICECVRIAMHTSRARRTKPQRQMLRKSLRMHTRRLVLGALGTTLVAAVTLATWNSYFRAPDQWKLLERFDNDEATVDERLEAFDGLDLSDTLVFLGVRKAIKETTDADIVQHALERLSQLAKQRPGSEEAGVSEFRQDLVLLLRDLLDPATAGLPDAEADGVRAEAFKAYARLKGVREVMKDVQLYAGSSAGKLADAMRDYLHGTELAELSDGDLHQTLRSLNAVMKDPFSNEQLVHACVVSLDRMPADQLVTHLIEAYKEGDVKTMGEDAVRPYVAASLKRGGLEGLERVVEIGASVEDRLVRLIPEDIESVYYSRELDFLVQALVVIQPCSRRTYARAFAAVDRLLRNWRDLGSANEEILDTAVRACVHLRPPDAAVPLDPIRQLSHHPEWPIREEAVTALGDLHDVQSARLLHTYASDSDAAGCLEVQLRAIDSLTKLGGFVREGDVSGTELEEIVETLISALCNPSSEMVNRSLKGLEQLGRSDDVPAILPLLVEQDIDVFLHANAAVLGILIRQPENASDVVRAYLRWHAGIEGHPLFPFGQTEWAVTGFYNVIADSSTNAAAAESAAKRVVEALADGCANGESQSIRGHARSLMDKFLHPRDPTNVPVIDPEAEPQARLRQIDAWRRWWRQARLEFSLDKAGLTQRQTER